MILNHDMKRCDIEVNLTLYAVYHFIDSNNLEREGPAKKGASKKKKKKKKTDAPLHTYIVVSRKIHVNPVSFLMLFFGNNKRIASKSSIFFHP